MSQKKYDFKSELDRETEISVPPHLVKSKNVSNMDMLYEPRFYEDLPKKRQ